MKILFMGDPHIPYSKIEYWKELHVFNKHYKADMVLSPGDLFDQYAYSRYVKSTKGDAIEVEIEKSIAQVKAISKFFPKLTSLKGNHDDRIYKRAVEVGIPNKCILDPLKTVQAPIGWKWANKDYLVIDSVVYTHGWFSAPVKHTEYFNESCAHGHLHSKAGITFISRNNRTLFNLCVGSFADTKSIALQYGAVKYSTSTAAFASITNGVPQIYSL